jgi:DNA ligase-1
MKPMLAKPFKAAWLKFPIYLQPKLDGMRAIWTGEKLLSRTGKEIKSVPTLVEFLKANYADFPLDGELYNHEKTFQEQISSVRKTVNIDEDLSIQYHVYDTPVENISFSERYKLLKTRLVETDRFKLVRTIKFKTIKVLERQEDGKLVPEELEEVDLNRFDEEGYEGTMIRNADGLYKKGKRSSDLMKVKTFQDDEFPIVGVYQLTRKEKIIVPPHTPGAIEHSDGVWKKDGVETPVEMAGGLVLQLPDGRTFESGSGYDDETRIKFWKNPPIGKLATIKFQELTDGGVPRFPIFKAIRDYE